MTREVPTRLEQTAARGISEAKIGIIPIAQTTHSSARSFYHVMALPDLIAGSSGPPVPARRRVGSPAQAEDDVLGARVECTPVECAPVEGSIRSPVDINRHSSPDQAAREHARCR
jgi:hypothetical protein